MPYEAPKRRRVNAVGAYCGSDFEFHAESGKLTAQIFVNFLEKLVPAPEDPPTVVVVDNYSIHKAKAIQPQLKDLQRRRLSLFFLPPYSPELNKIEPCWRHIKHGRMTIRLFHTQQDLHQGVEASLKDYQLATRGQT